MKKECWEIISELESDNGRIFKENVIKRELDNEDFIKGLRYALNSYKTFGIQKVPEYVPSKYQDVDQFPDEEFYDVLRQLETRELTGNAMRDRVANLCMRCSCNIWNNWYRRILLKDLKCGVGITTVNKLLDEKIPVYEVMRAEDIKKHPKKLKGMAYIEPKFDGIRATVICDKEENKVEMLSRNGKQLVNFPHIIAQFENVMPQLTESMVFDGEVMSDTFQNLMKQVYRKRDVQTEDDVINLFDVVPLKDFRKGECKTPLQHRKDILKGFTYGDKVSLIEHTEISLDDGFEVLDKYMTMWVENGLEGAMIKPINSVYRCKKCSLWLKYKPYIDMDLTIVAVEEGQNRNKGRLGALVVEGEHEGKFVRTNVGTGFTDKERRLFWAKRESLIGQIVEVRCDTLTKNQHATDDERSLRFASFRRFRGFEIGEKM